MVTETVMIMSQANCTGSSESIFQITCIAIDVTNAAAIATTSLQAFTRHQYHRSSSTPPVPAPVTISSFHAPAIESM